MAAPTTAADFLDLLQQSNLLEEGGLARCRALANDAIAVESLADELVRAGLLTPFHSTNLLRGRWRGFFLGKYRLLEQLGAGGMGQVFLAAHQMMRRLVAIKVLTLRPGADPSILPRFQREARAMAALDHPNIVHAYDCDQDDKVHYIVLEYIDGISLSDLVKKRGPVPVERAANYIFQAAQGLHHAHECGIVHRDIKPGNILLDRLGVVKILDLGLARLFHDHMDNLTVEHNAGRALGTADYLAPEQVSNSHDVDPRADIYSLGASFYFLLTGKPPFHGATVAQKLIMHQLKPPTPLRELRPEVPEELEAIIERMMAKQPAERQATAEEVCQVLEPWTGFIEEPNANDMPRPCPAVNQLIEQYLPAAARKKNSDQVRRPPARPTMTVPTVSASAASLAMPAGGAGRASPPAGGGPRAASSGARRTASVPVVRPTPGPPALPRRRDTHDDQGGLGETPLAPSRMPTESAALGRPNLPGAAGSGRGGREGDSPRGPTPKRPASLPETQALFGNWMSDLNPSDSPTKGWLGRWWSVVLVVGLLVVGGVVGVAGNLFLHGSAQGDRRLTGRPLTPAEAAGHVDQHRTVEMRVRSIAAVRGGQLAILLSSEADWKTRGNFSVLLDGPAVERLRKEGVEDFVAHFKDRKIRATGTIQLSKDRTAKQRVQMVIADPASVQSVE